MAMTQQEKRAEIARIRHEINRAKRIYLLLTPGYTDDIAPDRRYVQVNRGEARRVVGMAIDLMEAPFKEVWRSTDLFIPPAYSSEPVIIDEGADITGKGRIDKHGRWISGEKAS